MVLDRRIDPLGVYTLGWAEIDICLPLDDEGDNDREGEEDEVERVDIEAEVEGERDDGVDIEAEVEGERATRCFLGVSLYDLGRISSSSSSSSASLLWSSPDPKLLPVIAVPFRW